MRDLAIGLAILGGGALFIYLFALGPLYMLLIIGLLAAPFVGRWARHL